VADHPRLAEQFSFLFPVFLGSAFTASPGHSCGRGKLSAPQLRGHCLGCPLAPHPRTPTGMTFSAPILRKFGRWSVGLGAPLSFPLLALPSPAPFSASFFFLLLTPPSSPSQVLRRALLARVWRRPGVRALWAQDSKRMGRTLGLGMQVDIGPPV
jgi:hypothetical protein